MKLPTEEVDDVTALRTSWRKLVKRASDISSDLHHMQVIQAKPFVFHTAVNMTDISWLCLAANGCLEKFDIHNACVSKQGAFRKKLITEVTGLKQDARSFRIEWDAHGPMTLGLDPLEAEHRLKKYQPAFEVSKHCYGNL